MIKTAMLYEVREFTGSLYSKRIGFKLRKRKDAVKIAKFLIKKDRDVFLSPVAVSYKDCESVTN